MTWRKTRQPKRLNEQELYWYAVNVLAARARSTGELRRLLKRRALEAEFIEAVIERLRDRNYLNDGRFAEHFAMSRVENQRQGRVRVLHDLRAKQVSRELAEQAVRKTYDEVDESALLHEQVSRRVRLTGPPSDPRKVASLYRSLRRAGFAHAAIVSELRRLKADTESLESIDDEDCSSGSA